MITDYPLITLGSPYGVGYEIFLLAFKNSKIFESHVPYCIGSEIIINFFLKLTGIDIPYKAIRITDLDRNIDIENIRFVLINIDTEQKTITGIDEIDKKIDGKIAYESIKNAAILVKDGYFKSITTLPVSKENINIFDKSFKGHTEFFQKMWGEKQVFMTFISKKMNILFLSTHIPLNEVSSYLTKDIVENGIKTALALKNKFKFKKKICFLGINPHAGENGLLGKEEIWIKEILKKYPEVLGPIPADSAFTGFSLKKYSLFISGYHDQGSIPFKMLAFEDGVNLSFGMKYIRTSVDHGTAVDLIGKKTVNIKSFLNSYKTAIKLSK
jgi:4-phospho-D-threonate 3-dehydrogenase / 4-phospho-D-erythronate 3-dehydrogenase